MESHLLQMRGLKLKNGIKRIWKGQSHLLQMRGLKPRWSGVFTRKVLSHLLQMRGLKHTRSFVSLFDFLQVASFTDAWIETYSLNVIIY